MNFSTTLHLLCYGSGLLGGPALIAGLFTAKGRACAHWMRVAMGMAGAFAFCWSLSGFALLFYSHSLSRSAYLRVYFARNLTEGMALGILLLLIFSGEFVRAFGRRKP